MDEDTFCGIENVKKLLMVNCGITVPPNVTPLQLSLKYLIPNDNHIRSFPVNYFEGLGLTHLQVKDNLLTSVPPYQWTRAFTFGIVIIRKLDFNHRGTLDKCNLPATSIYTSFMEYDINCKS